MSRIIVLIGVGGTLGSISRFIISHYSLRFFGISQFLPFGTLIVNITGSLLIGMAMGYFECTGDHPEWRFFLTSQAFVEALQPFQYLRSRTFVSST